MDRPSPLSLPPLSNVSRYTERCNSPRSITNLTWGPVQPAVKLNRSRASKVFGRVSAANDGNSVGEGERSGNGVSSRSRRKERRKRKEAIFPLRILFEFLYRFLFLSFFFFFVKIKLDQFNSLKQFIRNDDIFYTHERKREKERLLFAYAIIGIDR